MNFESPVLFSKCLRAKIYCNMNVHFDPQGCQTLLLKESELFFYLWAPGLLHKKYLQKLDFKVCYVSIHCVIMETILIGCHNV